MRKLAGVLVAVALVVPAGIMAAAPAGAAGGTKCKGGSSTATFSPPLTPAAAKVQKPVRDTVKTTAGTLSGCTGGGVTGATFTYVGVKAKAPGDTCLSLAKFSTNSVTSGVLTVKWKPTGISTIPVSFHKVKGKATSNTVTGTVKTGLFKGAKISSAFAYTFVPKTGCVTTPGAKVSVKITATTLK